MEQFLTLEDGRRLSYGDYGDPHAPPILLLHGIPGSRLTWEALPDFPSKHKFRVIVPERPGYGHSTFQSQRHLLDWSEDIISLIDHLHLAPFQLFAISGGGPYGLALAWKYPERIKSMTISPIIRQ